MKKMMIVISVLLSLTFILGACSGQGKEYKEELLTALQKETALQQYLFEGSIDYDLPLAAILQFITAEGQTQEMLQSLDKSRIAFSGKADQEQMKLEADAEFTAGDLTLSIPLMIQDERLYVHVPMVNVQDEYLAIPFDRSFLQKSEEATAALKQLFEVIVEKISGKWFDAEEESIDGESNKNGNKTISIEISEKSWLSIMLDMKDALPELLQILVDEHWITESAAADLEERLTSSDMVSLIKDAKLTKPGQLAFILNSAQQLTGIHFELYLDVDGQEQYFDFYYELIPLNESPVFDRQVPEQIIHYEDLLKFVQP